jgi:hypothetical protein
MNWYFAVFCRRKKEISYVFFLQKFRKKKKQKAAQEAQMANIQAQAQANQQTAEKAALFEVQKQQALTQETVNVEQDKSQFEIQRMQTEAEIKKQLMELQYQYDMQLASFNRILSELDQQYPNGRVDLNAGTVEWEVQE